MTIDVAAMRAGIRKAMGMDTSDANLSDADLNLYLNRSLWEIDNKFPFKEKEKTVTFPLIEGVRNYSVPVPYEAVKTIAVIGRYDQLSHPLRYMEVFEYNSLYDLSEFARGQPSGYTRENDFIRFYPTPDYAYTIVLKRLILLDDLSDTNTVPEIPRVWHEIIQFGGLWRAFIDFGDIARANHIKNHQVSLINSTVPVQAKEEGQDKFAGVEVLRSDYDLSQWWRR